MPTDPSGPEEIGQLKQAIDTNRVERVKSIMTRNPARAPRPAWLWQRRSAHVGGRMPGPVGAPGPAGLAMAKWMIENGSDVHQGGDAPLMRWWNARPWDTHYGFRAPRVKRWRCCGNAGAVE